MKRLLLCVFLTCCLPHALSAQRKVIDQARTIIKSGKEPQKAEKLMTDLLKDSANRNNEKIWLTLADAVKLQYQQGNEKLYLKQKYDTTTLFLSTRRIFDIYETFDSIEALPNKKGKVEIKHREKHAEYLNGLRPNLYNGGLFFLKKADFANAWGIFDTYLNCAQQPMFAKYDYSRTDTLMPQAAYRALQAGYRLKDTLKVAKYQTLAESDTSKLDNVLVYVAELFANTGDTAVYVNTLRRGFAHTPSHPFFFPRLVDYYNARQQTDSAHVFIDEALAADSMNALFLFAKSSALLNAGEYKECITVTERLISVNDSLQEAYCNMALAYYNQAVALEQSMPRNRKKRNGIKELYQKSLPYMEKYRAMAPEQTNKWVPALYVIYLNLNMGKEFEEIDALRAKLKL